MARRRARVAMIVAAAACAAGLAGMAVPALASQAGGPGGPAHVLSVGGEVMSPATYTAAQLAELPQTTATVTVGFSHVTVTGVLLETLVSHASPAYPALLNTKNELLRVTVTVRGAGHRQATFSVGELDANFGNHAALLALTQNGHPVPFGPELVVPGDGAPLRFLPRVSRVTVGIATAPATDTTPPADSPVEVIDGPRVVTLSAALLGRLPAETLKVSFEGPGGVQSHTETGPLLAEVLAAAGIWPTLDTWVAAVGSDNYVATVTPFEQFVGGRPLQLSLNEDGVTLAQPRLVTDGDVKGGRYVSDVVDLYVGTGPAS